MPATHTTVVLTALVAVCSAATSVAQPFDGGCGPSTVPHSNRAAGKPCPAGGLGDECAFVCDEGYFATGRHVCTNYTAAGQPFIDMTFFGGRCERICSGADPTSSPASASGRGDSVAAMMAPTECEGAAKIRYNSTDEDGPCFRAACFNSSDSALRHVARSNYAYWSRAYHTRTGMYIATGDMAHSTGFGKTAAVGPTGIGMMFECVAAALGWQTMQQAQQRVELTLRSLAGRTPGFAIPRNPRGFYSHFVDADTGSAAGQPQGCMMCSGLMMGGVLFAKNYFAANAPHSTATHTIAQYADEIFNSTRFEQLLCSDAGANSTVDPNGTAIPMIQDMANGCSALMTVEGDGMYHFNEEHYTVWFGYEQKCAAQPEDKCDDAALQTMWDNWQRRRFHPIDFYNTTNASFPLLSVWSGYLVQLPFYTTHSFNSDPTYRELFRSHWQADWAFYNNSALAAGYRGRYGLGAGPTAQWCAEGSAYDADLLDGSSSSHCVMYSPYITAGYLPVAPELISQHLLELLEDGDTVLALPPQNTSDAEAGSGGGPGGTGGTDDVPFLIMWRKSLLDPDWTQGYGITAVDFSSELFGLSTLWLGEGFYQRYSNHFPRSWRA